MKKGSKQVIQRKIQMILKNEKCIKFTYNKIQIKITRNKTAFTVLLNQIGNITKFY